MWSRRSIVAAIVALAVSSPAGSQVREKAVTIDDAAWLAGRWVGGGPMGEAENSWSPPAAGQMVGHYRLSKSGRIIFYELMVLDVHEGGLRLSVKHFRSNFTAWEPDDQWQRFEPRSVTADEIRFDGVVIRKLGPDRHSATVTHQDPKTGKIADTVFTYRRAPL